MIPIEMMISELAGSSAAIRTLFKELSPTDAVKTLARVIADKTKGLPWNELPPPADRQELLSRRQIGPAVLLERNLRKVVSHERARELTSRVVTTGAVDFLTRNVPAMKKNEILSMSEGERKKFVQMIQSKFFNADAELIIEGETSLNMRVTRCRFVELLASIGEKDMAPVFCEGDRIFFDERQPDINLERPETLSGGGDICDFRFNWKD